MSTQSPRQQDAPDEPSLRTESVIKTCETRPGKRVFLEDGNTEGWIATDYTVDPQP